MSRAIDRFSPDIKRRRLLQGAVATLLLPVVAATQGKNEESASVLAVRVWPARAYTRITIESNAPLQFNQFMVPDPARLVVDMDGISWGSELANIGARIGADDPYVKQLRAGRFKPGTVRVVLDLKAEVKPQVFTLQPYGEYKHRLVIDLFPAKVDDPLMAFADMDVPEGAASKPVQEVKSRKEDKAPEKLDVDRLITVVIDPGHGGEDPGAIGKSGTYEKTIVLAIAQKLKAKIDAQKGMRAVLTRDDDYFVPLGERVLKARKAAADLFVSIHADAVTRRDARGSSVYALSEGGATSTAAKWLAKSQNDADLIGGMRLDGRDRYLAHTLFDLTQTATINDSLKLGKAMLNEIGGINTLHRGQVEQAAFAVLKAPDIPSILVETAFISNPEEEAKLKDDAYQHKMANALLTGIKRYFDKNPPSGKTRLALKST
ncbi:N-acetylmuramoyl-L-alanine amidase [Burkholderiaceae bacterium DAT-1]|nr:N-acetylmuramoyl-L-alanine amidase [Burkholderiaceae bacterium DAT-1]